MEVAAKNTRGGRRYVTQKGVIVEVAPTSRNDDSPRRHKDGRVLVWVVNDAGVKDSTLAPIDANYTLIDHLPPEPPAPPRRRGREVHEDKTWRGWAYNHPEVPEAVLDEAKGQGCYLVAATNYITVGWGGRKVFVLFRSGVLGFDEVSKYFVAFSPQTAAGRFSVVRIELEAVIASGLRVEMLRALRQHLADFKGVVSRADISLPQEP